MLLRRTPSSPVGFTTTQPVSGRRKAWRTFLVIALVLLLALAGWVGVTGALALKNITTKNTGAGASFFHFTGDIPADQLKTEGDGRINVLVLGVDKSLALADSIEVVSLDPVNHTLAMVSVPRDLYVSVPGNGRSKINAVYGYGMTKCQKTNSCDPAVDGGGELMKDTVSQILNVPIQYFIRLDFDGFTKIVDAIGGIQVNVDKPISDPLYPDTQERGYSPFYISAGLHTLDGKTALKYARSRETTSDFDRSRRQQQVISAVKDKALSANVLTNPKKLTDIISTLGSHLRTDLQPSEMVQLAGLIKDVPSGQLTSEVLDTSPDGPLQATTDPSAGYIIYPKLGIGNYADLQDIVDSFLQEPYLIKEKAGILVQYATDNSTTGKAVVKHLKALGYKVIDQQTVTSAGVKSTISIINDKPYTEALLQKRFSASTSKAKSGGVTTPGVDLVLTIGSTYIFK